SRGSRRRPRRSSRRQNAPAPGSEQSRQPRPRRRGIQGAQLTYHPSGHEVTIGRPPRCKPPRRPVHTPPTQERPPSTSNFTTPRAVAYYRMSTGLQEASIAEQQAWVRQAARREGLELLAEFQDEAIAGSEIENRPGLQALVNFCQRRPRGQPVEVLVL